MTDEPRGNWWTRNTPQLKTVFRLLLGVVWLIDGVLKFTSGFINGFPGAVQNAANNAPGWLSGWYTFWLNQANMSGTLIVYTVGILEVALGVALIVGFGRKIAYAGGVILSLLIWAVPEGFGGPYATGSGGTDVGTGVMYALVFLGLIVINASYGPSRFSVDYFIEKRFPWWAKLAEFGSSASRGTAPPSTPKPAT